MLEQAVYAGRNHTLSLAAALTAAALFAAPAQAADVGRLSLGSSIDALVAAPDGGVWSRIKRRDGYAIERSDPEGSFVTTAVEDPLTGPVAVGPDGQAWFSTLFTVVRSDPGSHISRLDLGQRIGDVTATGPDGTLWGADPDEDTLAHVTAQGVVTRTPFSLPKACPERADFREMARASDGAMWIADSGCSRLIRITPDGTPSVFRLADDEAPFALAADAEGGVWFAEVRTPVRVGHVTSTGAITRLKPASRHGAPTDVAVGPDGSAWFAFNRCVLGRVPPGGAFSYTHAPIPASFLAFNPAGGLWLASPARLVLTSPTQLGGRCDDTPPRPTMQPAWKRTVRLAAVRRGFRIAVGEPAAVEVIGFFPGSKDNVGEQVQRTLHDPGAVRYRLPAKRLRELKRQLAAGKRPEIDLFADVTDVEGNIRSIGGEVRVTP